jgi:hypothetical protein
MVEKTLVDDSQIELLDAELRALDTSPDKVVLDLRVHCTVSPAGRQSFEERIAQNVRAAFCGMRLNDSGLMLEPTEADMDDIDKSGFVRVTADRFKAMVEDRADLVRASIAALAVKRL